MILFVLAILLWIVALISVGAFFLVEDSDGKAVAAVVGIGALLVGVLFFVLGGIREVPTKSVGVPTAFGKVQPALGPGIHWKAPWTTVNILDGTVQTTTFEGKNCLTVRIAEQQTACVDVSTQWQIRDGVSASKLYQTYAHTGNVMSAVQNALVVRRLEVNLSNAFENYNPINSIQLANSGTPVGSVKNPSVTELSRQVLVQMKADIGSTINVRDILIPRITYDPAVETQLSAVLRQTAQTNVAQQAVKTAQANAAANRALAQSVSNDPGVLVSKCLDEVGSAIQNNYSLPAGFNCFGSSSVGVLAGK